MSYKQLAKDIVQLVGDKENIISVVHCATRLRFKLKDEAKADTETLMKRDDVVTVKKAGGQYQVVIGQHVSQVYKELIEETDLVSSSQEETNGEKGKLFDRFVDTISAIFTPFLGVLAATGILRALLNLGVVIHEPFGTTGTYIILQSISSGFLDFLPIIIAYTAAKKFKVNEFVAMAIAFALVHPSVAQFIAENGEFTFLGFIPVRFSGIVDNPLYFVNGMLPEGIDPYNPFIVMGGYTGSVIPIVLAVYLQSHLEPFFKKITPKVFSIFGSHLLSLLVIVPLTFVVIGPIGTIVGEGIGSGFEWLIDIQPIVAGILMGGTWQILVMFGLHWALVPVAIMNLAVGGSDILLPLVIPAVIAQAGAALAVALKTRNRKLKELGIASSISGIFGITEPAIYGVNIPLKKPFYAGLIGGAVGGGIMGAFNVSIFAFTSSILSIPAFIPTASDGTAFSYIIGPILAIIAAFGIAFVLTLVFGFEDKIEKEKA